MPPPPIELRSYVAIRALELRERPDEEAEAGLVELLETIEGQIELDDDLGRDDFEESWEGAEQLLADVEAWTSVVSHAMAEVYAPHSPSPRQLAGWGISALRTVRSIIRKLARVVRRVCRSLGASSFSFSVSFPWGVSISLEWDV